MKTHTQLAKWFFATLLFSTLVLVFPNSPAADSFEDGVQAHKVGDYKKALEIFKPLAEQEISKAQYRLGIMYAKGRGVPQDHAEAAKWVRKGRIKTKCLECRFEKEIFIDVSEVKESPDGRE